MCGCLSGTQNRGPGLQPRHVPWLGIKPVTLCFSGWCSIHWATPARAVSDTLKKKADLMFCSKKERKQNKKNTWPCPASWVGWSVIPTRQGYGCDPQAGHRQESTNKCTDKWNNKSMSFCLSVCLSLPPVSLPTSSFLFLSSLKLINKNFFKLCKGVPSQSKSQGHYICLQPCLESVWHRGGPRQIFVE